MKGLIFTLVSLLAGFSATAETITLGPSECGIVKQCVNIPNNAAADISLYGAPGYPWFYVYLNGVEYKAAQASGSGGDQVPLSDANGDVIYLTYSFTTYVTCIRSGRGQHCSTHWTLVSGGTLARDAAP